LLEIFLLIERFAKLDENFTVLGAQDAAMVSNVKVVPEHTLNAVPCIV